MKRICLSENERDIREGERKEGEGMGEREGGRIKEDE